MNIRAIEDFCTHGVRIRSAQYKGHDCIEISMPSSSYQDPARDTLTDRPFLAWLPIDFSDGEIQIDLASTLAPDAPSFARGFIGVAFRISQPAMFEGMYLRPTNSRADDQVRRNHTVQYFSCPDHDFARLRRDAPEKYESYVDVGLGEWTHLKILVSCSVPIKSETGSPRVRLRV